MQKILAFIVKRLLLVVLFYVTVLLNGTAQNFGDVSEELIKQSVHPRDSFAAAAYYVANSSARYRFTRNSGVLLNIEYHYRIKIYQIDGEEYGKFEISLYNNSSDYEKVRNIEAYSFNYENGKVVKTKLNKNEIFEEKSSKNYKRKIFAVPNVKPGSVVEVRYKIQSPFNYSIPKWYFQKYIPVEQSRFELIVPDYIKLTPVSTGSIPIKSTTKDMLSSSHGEVKYILEASELPAMKRDKYVLNPDDYRTGIKYELHSVTYRNETDYLSKDWPSISKMLSSKSNWGEVLEKDIKELKGTIIQANKLPSEKEKIAFIYNHIRDNVAWNKRIGIYPS